MLSDTKTRSDNDAAYGRLIEDVAAGNVGHRHAVTLGHLVHDFQQILQRLPTARFTDEATVLEFLQKNNHPALGMDSLVG